MIFTCYTSPFLSPRGHTKIVSVFRFLIGSSHKGIPHHHPFSWEWLVSTYHQATKKNGDDWGMVQMTFYIFYDIALPTLIRILDLKIIFRSKGQPQSLLSEPRSQGQVLEQNPTPWAGCGFIDISGLLLLR